MPSEVKKIVSGILRYLETTRTLHLLPQITEALSQRVHEQAEASQAIVTSSYKLGKQEIAQIQQALDTIFRKKLRVVNRIDSRLIAGLRISVRDKVIDLSLAKTLQNIKTKLEHE